MIAVDAIIEFLTSFDLLNLEVFLRNFGIFWAKIIQMAALEENHWLEAYLGGNDWVKHNSAVDYFGKKHSIKDILCSCKSASDDTEW